MGHPLDILGENGIPEFDVGIMRHGFAAHGRDYAFVFEDSLGRDPGTYQLTFTHVVKLTHETRVHDHVWPVSWDDLFTDYAKWEAAGTPSGFVFGACWSLAYPGISARPDDAETQNWSARLAHQMYKAQVETELFSITLVFSEARLCKLSRAAETVRKVINPLPDPGGD